MEELVESGFKPHQVYNAVKRKELVNTNAQDAWGRKVKTKGLFLSTVIITPMNFTALQVAWHHHQPQEKAA